MKKIISILGVITFFFLASLSTSCYTQRKAERQVIKADVTYPALVSGYCGKKYAPKTSTGNTEIQYLEGETITDTIVLTDTIENTIKVVKTLVKNRVDTLYSKRVDTVENTARISELQAIENAMSVDLSESNVKIALLKKSRSNWMWISISLMVIIASWFGVKFVIPEVLNKL